LRLRWWGCGCGCGCGGGDMDADADAVEVSELSFLSYWYSFSIRFE